MIDDARRLTPLRHLDASRALTAAHLVRTGEVFSLDMPLNGPALTGRAPLEHVPRKHNEIRPRGDDGYVVVNDDLITFAMQGASHWDALAHWGAIEPGSHDVYSAGRGLEETYPHFGAASLGVGLLGGAVVTRGVLLDLVEYAGGPAATYLGPEITVDRELVESCLREHGLDLQPGDAVLTYTGFQERLAAWSTDTHDRSTPTAAGVDVDALPLFGEAGTFALISDNPCVEPLPMTTGRFHTVALKHLGIHLGELWALTDLALACRQDRLREFLLVASPLSLSTAFGSPANAVAIR